tara:strand:+ start:12341 stop:13450 length:1110 start_codon:yes stop_codon:yes gene_type:complete
MLNVVFRADASIEIGSGHVMRCLTLADQLQRAGAECQFICRGHSGNLMEYIRSKGYKVHSLPVVRATTPLENNESTTHAHWLGSTWQEDAAQCAAVLIGLTPDWLIVDHYALDLAWETSLRAHCKHLGAIDDLADRRHIAELLIDQSLDRSAAEYHGLVPDSCTLLTGSHYALLRPEFSQWRQASLKRRTNPSVENVLVNLGGVDKDNITGRVITGLEGSSLDNSCQITVVMGGTAPHLKTVTRQALTSRFDIDVKVGVSNMAELMANADLAIGAAGSTTWERCCLGLPSIMIVLADNQRFIALRLQERQIAKIVNSVSDDFESTLAAHIDTLDTDMLRSMSEISRTVTDGSGVASVATLIRNRADTNA